jgi:hypothetical protein
MTDEQFHQLITWLALIEKRLETIEESLLQRHITMTKYSPEQLKNVYPEFDFVERDDDKLIDVYYQGQRVHQLHKGDL